MLKISKRHLTRGQMSLDLLSLAVSGMRDGVGPLLTLFLVRDRHLTPVEISTILAAGSFASFLAQTAIGAAYDRVKRKPLLVAMGAFLLAFSGLIISATENVAIILIAQVGCGLAMSLLSGGLPAISVAITRSEHLGRRIVRNEVFSKVGNFSAIALTGYLSQKYSLHWVFYVSAISAVPVIATSLWASRVWRREEKSLRAEFMSSRPPAVGTSSQRFRAALARPEFLAMLVLCFLFQFANAAMFIVFEQNFGRVSDRAPALISISMIVTQATIMFTIFAFGWIAEVRRIERYLLFGFVLIVTRGMLLALAINDPRAASLLMGAQVLDGIIAAILLTLPLRWLARTEHENFNLLSGVLGTSVSLSAMLSTLASGWLITSIGHAQALIALSGVAIVGLACAAARVAQDLVARKILRKGQ